MADAQHAGRQREGAVGIKETITSLIIAFMLAFLFRGFVIEGFLIPTGSMAPTLMGKHLRMRSDQSGYDWTVGPWTYTQTPSGAQPVRTQTDITVQDPMSGIPMQDTNRRLAAGDRVFVLKYLPWLHHPERWDVVVFKNPGTHENYIKRLVGLPGEQVAIVDGDIFTRKYVEAHSEIDGWESWTEPDWSVQRKSERVQREMLQNVFDSSYTPEGNVEYRSPLSAVGAGWSGVESAREYVFSGSGSTELVWNDRRPLTDFNSYNQTRRGVDLFVSSDDPHYPTGLRPFPTSDLALALNIKGEAAGEVVRPTIEARGMELRASVDLGAGSASVEMRDASSPDAPWTQLDTGSFEKVGAGQWAHVEFWHIDQALWLFIDGELVAGGNNKGGYELTPAQRASAATGMNWSALQDYTGPGVGDGITQKGVFSLTDLYRKPSVRWEFEGGAFTLSHVSVRRDISYHINQGQATRGAHPMFYPTLNSEQYFMCGDNSSNSLDSRLWAPNSINTWVSQEIDNTPGVVNRDLIVGKAFVVYFPAPLVDGGRSKMSKILSVDFGHMRWIW